MALVALGQAAFFAAFLGVREFLLLRGSAGLREEELANAEEGSEERRLAERDKRRLEAFLKMTES